MVDLDRLWVVGSLLMLSACGRVTASATPLAAGNAPVIARAPQAAASANSAPARSRPSDDAASHRARGRLALYQRSCDLGSAIGCNDLAILLIKEPDKALPLLTRACSLGLARGCANLATQLLSGADREREHDRALELLTEACTRSDGYACSELGDVLWSEREQRGHQLGKIFGAYERGCSLSFLDACVSEAWLLRTGQGAARDSTRANELFRLTCDQQQYAGCAALGFSLLTDAKNPDEQQEGLRFLRLSCEHEQALGCFTLAGAALASSDANRLEIAKQLFKRACSLGSANACRAVEALEHPPKPTKSAPTAPAKQSADADDDSEDADE